ncbi:MAG: hypothetical protein ACOYXT_07980 [Bacteroidota bacterium]
MNVKYYLSGFIFICSALTLCKCTEAPRGKETHFTKADSLTDTYLALQDSMLSAWNVMIYDDNRKIKAMHNLLHELMISKPNHRDLLRTYEERLDQLTRTRYTQKSMANADVIEEYDFASNSLVTELISLAESQTEFAYNTTLQKLVDEIRAADQRVENYRVEYDIIAGQYNSFIEQNRALLKDIERDSFLEKKPLFEMVAEED